MEEETDPDGPKMVRQVMRFAALGTEMGIAIAIGVFGGMYLDTKFDSEPVFFGVGFVLGLGAAAKAIIDASKLAMKNLEDDGKSPPKED